MKARQCSSGSVECSYIVAPHSPGGVAPVLAPGRADYGGVSLIDEMESFIPS
jgi:hypothetical protein